MKKQLSLQKTMIRLVLIAYLAILLLLSCMDFYLIKRDYEEQQEREHQSVTQTVEYYSEGMEYIKHSLYDVFINNQDFYALSRGKYTTTAYSQAYDLRQTIQNLMNLDERWHGFYLCYDSNREIIYDVKNKYISSEDASRIYQSFRQTTPVTEQRGIEGWNCLILAERPYLLMSMRSGNAAIYGVISLTEIMDQIRGLTSKDIKLLVSDHDQVIYDDGVNDSRKLLENIKASQNQISGSYANGFYYGEKLQGSETGIMIFYKLHIMDYLSGFSIVLIALTLLSCLIAVLVYEFLKKNLVTSLYNLRLKMEAIRRNGNNRFLEVSSGFSEISEINDTLNIMVEGLEQQKLRTYEEYIEKQRSQLQFLQLQVKPHFYLNGLKAINALMMNHQTEYAQELIFGLSEHFRYLLRNSAETVTLDREIAFTRNYCRIMDHMTGRRVELKVQIPSELNSFEVPTLAIQTFAENSVKYAKLGDAESVLVIMVEGLLLKTEEGNYLDLIIRDNGNGYDPEVLREINKKEMDSNLHIGINNLKKRCSILYQNHAEFTFCNQEGAYNELIIPEETSQKREAE